MQTCLYGKRAWAFWALVSGALTACGTAPVSEPELSRLHRATRGAWQSECIALPVKPPAAGEAEDTGAPRSARYLLTLRDGGLAERQETFRELGCREPLTRLEITGRYLLGAAPEAGRIHVDITVDRLHATRADREERRDVTGGHLGTAHFAAQGFHYRREVRLDSPARLVSGPPAPGLVTPPAVAPASPNLVFSRIGE